MMMQSGYKILSLNFEVGKSESFEAVIRWAICLNIEVLFDIIWGDEENHELHIKILFNK